MVSGMTPMPLLSAKSESSPPNEPDTFADEPNAIAATKATAGKKPPAPPKPPPGGSVVGARSSDVAVTHEPANRMRKDGPAAFAVCRQSSRSTLSTNVVVVVVIDGVAATGCVVVVADSGSGWPDSST